MLFVFVLNLDESFGQSSLCFKTPPRASLQCIFKEEYFQPTFLLDDISKQVSATSSLVKTSSDCRNQTTVGSSLDFICDSSELTEIPTATEFPKNLTRFILNKTKVTV